MALAENAVYFFHFVALCLVWPYLPLFLSRYVSEAELGLLLGATRLVGVAASPAWAWLADAKCGRGPIFAVSWLCWQLLTPMVLVVARTPFLALVLLARSVFEAPLIPFVDAGVVARASFGAARLYGSLSWGLTAPVAGYVYANFGFAPCVAAAAFFACGAAVFAVDVVPAAKKPYDRVQRPSVTTQTLNPFSVDSDEGGAPPSSESTENGLRVCVVTLGRWTRSYGFLAAGTTSTAKTAAPQAKNAAAATHGANPKFA